MKESKPIGAPHYQYITRCVYPRHRHHWWVRFQGKSINISKRFYDDDLGGTRKALMTAKAFRDDILESWKPLILPKGYRHQPQRDGFSYTEYRDRRGRLRKFWVAGVQQDGRRLAQRFEVTGARPFHEAKRLAKEWRERRMRSGV